MKTRLNPEHALSASFAADVTDLQSRTARGLLETLLEGYRGRGAIRLWNGETVAADSETSSLIVVRQPALVRHMVLGRDLTTLAEAYLGGDLEIEGAIESVFDVVEFLRRRRFTLGERWRVLRQALQLPARYRPAGASRVRGARAPLRNDRDSISYHYDVSNEFYRLWLDPNLVYSCAYFSDAEQTLEAAQQDKLDYLCRKLRLRPGLKLLDVGCGWGALVSWAASHYGVEAHGITLSGKQYQYACERIDREGLQEKVKVELRDYRQLPPEGRYDRIVSVGMFEHIGLENFPTYFATMRRLLRQGGLFLNHGIASDSGWRETQITRFVNRYVFPDGALTRISEATAAMESAGLEVLDVENLRPHYALTLRNWVRRLEAAAAEARALTSDKTYRLWRLYMAGSAYYFTKGSLRVYQVLNGIADAPPAVPLRRDDLYARG
jgi:cyclopropane-fatty-acyl-phospholipid synthase